ncbi:class I glutamine amidotransferase-like protein [Paraphysoderma sedebokerense]|nr:class I glutamine amidotransferase-like protein [Paraphysoderma sedebokerense]
MTSSVVRGSINNILFLTTNVTKIPDEKGTPTGLDIQEFAHLWYVISKNVKYSNVVFGTPKGGAAQPDPNSIERAKGDHIVDLFMNNKGVQENLKNTAVAGNLAPEDFCCVSGFIDGIKFILPSSSTCEAFFVVTKIVIPGGHGPMFDLVDDKKIQHLIETVYTRGGVICSICHGAAALVNVEIGASDDRRPLIQDRNITCFSDHEENTQGASYKPHLPFLLESRLRDRGANLIVKKPDEGANVIVDGRLVTGQNPVSGISTGENCVAALMAVLGKEAVSMDMGGFRPTEE